eukprot:1975990-Rhodomonas_salina.1
MVLEPSYPRVARQMGTWVLVYTRVHVYTSTRREYESMRRGWGSSSQLDSSTSSSSSSTGTQSITRGTRGYDIIVVVAVLKFRNSLLPKFENTRTGTAAKA